MSRRTLYTTICRRRQVSNLRIIPNEQRGSNSNEAAAVMNRDSSAATYAYSIHSYHGDQIGSSRLMTARTRWPVWQGTFLPFGEEYNPRSAAIITSSPAKSGIQKVSLITLGRGITRTGLDGSLHRTGQQKPPRCRMRSLPIPSR
jgi:hypothetical protein